MAIYAVVENNTVMNIIVADSKEIAEKVTGKLCIESTQENTAVLGCEFDGEKFIVRSILGDTLGND
jgi:hypothetical protein